MKTTSQDDPLETRVHDLELENATLRQHMKDAVEAWADLKRTCRELDAEVRWIRQRMAQFWPERSYCPKCRALVHAAARNCRACGASWGEKPDPKAGLPR